MTLASQLFLFFFLPLTLAVYALVPRRGKQAVLVLASLAFCAWASPAATVPLLAVIAIDYGCGRVIARGAAPDGGSEGAAPERPARWRRLALAVSVASNLGLLATFKYAAFIVENVDAVLGTLGIPALASPDAFRLALPLGISFYTFQSLAYTIDLYHRRTQPARSLVEYAAFLSFFARLTAGPIVRFKELAEQLRAPAFGAEAFARGVLYFSLGLAKKVLLANPCGFVADSVFAAAGPAPLDAWLGLVAYAFQIYFDFSGYTDMAIGAGLLFGLELPPNFDRPYRARSITEFWRRWHITLSNWLRDFLFLPIAYATVRRLERFHLSPRTEEYASYVTAALTTMALAGLWHGAAWTFVIWGVIHGTAMAIERAVGKKRAYKRIPDPLKAAMTFLIVLVAWVFFRSATAGDALSFLGRLVGLGSPGTGAALVAAVIRVPQHLVVVAMAAVVTWAGVPTAVFVARPTVPRAIAAVALLLLALAMLAVQSYRPFLYSVF